MTIENVPSDNTTYGQNLDDTPSQPLFGASDIGNSGAGHISPMDEPQESAVQEDQDAGLETDAPKPAKRRSRLQDRISRLVQQRNDRSTEAESLRDQLASVNSELQALRTQVSRLPAPAAAPSTSPGTDHSFLSGEGLNEEEGNQSPPAPAQQGDLRSIVQGELARALKPIIDSTRANSEKEARVRKHQASFAETAQDYPELADPNSEIRVIFDQIYDGRPDLQRLDDAPAVIAPMARGILADQKRSEQAQAGKKRAASIHVPQPAAVEAEPGQAKLSASAAEALDLAKKRIRDNVADFNDYKLIRLAGQRQTR
jgi:hypothetical protein